MLSWCKKIISYCSLFYYVRKYYVEDKRNLELLKKIANRITECGAVMIKFTQWLTPKLELIYVDTDEATPEWLSILENFYENCSNHELEYTKSEYNRVFGGNVEDKYIFENIIGSGSIGQVHLVTNKKSKVREIIKILHPNVRGDINFFNGLVKFLLWFPCINIKCNSLFPFDIFEFIRQFKLQTNFVNEANHILYFTEEYKNNDFIIIPKLIKVSESILIMSYEPGTSLSEIKINDYHKNKIVNLYHLFVRNNHTILNYNHGDLHPGNWRIREDRETNKHRLIIYDFGYCWEIQETLFTEMGDIFT